MGLHGQGLCAALGRKLPLTLLQVPMLLTIPVAKLSTLADNLMQVTREVNVPRSHPRWKKAGKSPDSYRKIIDIRILSVVDKTRRDVSLGKSS